LMAVLGQYPFSAHSTITVGPLSKVREPGS